MCQPSEAGQIDSDVTHRVVLKPLRLRRDRAGWPLSRRTNAAASRALYCLADADSASCLVGGFFFAAGAGVIGTRSFLAGMTHLLGGKLASGSARRAATPGQEDYLDRAATSSQFPTKSRSFWA